MQEKKHAQLNLFLLLSLLLVILMFPVLDHGGFRHMILGVLLFVPIGLATVKLAEKRLWVLPGAILASATFILTLVSWSFPGRTLLGFKWGLLALFFGLTVGGLFSYLRNARFVSGAQLYTAASIYLLLGMLWFALYMTMVNIDPGAFLLNNLTLSARQSDLLYFSLVTLSTIGYGDVVPVHGEARMLAALEGITGVLYVAITVALLVNAYRRQGSMQ